MARLNVIYHRCKTGGLFSIRSPSISHASGGIAAWPNAPPYVSARLRTIVLLSPLRQRTTASTFATQYAYSVPTPAGSAPLAADSIDGLRANRNPTLPFREVGASVLRYADRQPAAPQNQPPPRNTRFEPVAAPSGSEIDS